MNIIDKFFSYFSPTAGLQRVKAREQAKLIGNISRKYEGAARKRRTDGWKTTNTDANAASRADLQTLRNRSRDLIRNNAWAERAIQVIENNVVGKGIVVQFFSKSKRIQDGLNAAWKNWTESTGCDVTGVMDFPMIQRLSMRTIVESGEVLVRLKFTKDTENPLKLQILEPDFINSQQISGEKTKNQIIDGIEVDADGMRVAYHLFTNHPGSTDYYTNTKNAYETVRVLSRFIAHGYRMTRPGQLRGIPVFAPTIMNLRELDEYLDAQIVKQKISACMTAFVTDPQGAAEMSQDEVDLLSHFEPGAIQVLGQGQDVTVANPPSVEGFKDFVTTVLRSVAAGVGVSYEAMTGDLSQVNFSSARMGWLEMARNIDVWRHQVLIPMILEPIVKNFVMAQGLTGGVVPNDLTWTYTAPRREMIDPTREVPALIDGIRGGLFTLNDVLKQFGSDPVTHLQDIADMNAKLDEKKIILDSDPRNVASNGKTQSEPFFS